MIAALGSQFHPEYGPVLRAALFALDRHRARIVTGAGPAPGTSPGIPRYPPRTGPNGGEPACVPRLLRDGEKLMPRWPTQIPCCGNWTFSNPDCGTSHLLIAALLIC